MDVDESSELRAEHEGLTYLFCSEKCRQRFLRDHREFAYDSSTDEQSGQGTAPKNEKKRQKVAIVVSSDSQILITRQVRQSQPFGRKMHAATTIAAVACCSPRARGG